MKQVIEIIKQAIAECERDGDMFHMPTLNKSQQISSLEWVTL